MVWAQQLLYIFHKSPMWISNKWFKCIDSQFQDFIWKKKKAHISLTTLQYNKDRGGLAFLHAKMYFMASQMQQLTGWGQCDTSDPIAKLISLLNPNLPASSYLEIDLPSLPSSSLKAALLGKVWKALKEALNIADPLDFTPLWHNLKFSWALQIDRFLNVAAKGYFIL